MNNLIQHEEKDAVVSCIIIVVIACYCYENGHRKNEGRKRTFLDYVQLLTKMKGGCQVFIMLACFAETLVRRFPSSIFLGALSEYT
jgi:hypothetical protein